VVCKEFAVVLHTDIIVDIHITYIGQIYEWKFWLTVLLCVLCVVILDKHMHVHTHTHTHNAYVNISSQLVGLEVLTYSIVMNYLHTVHKMST